MEQAKVISKKRKGYDNILENVVIAPWWSHSMFESENTKIEQKEKINY